MSHPRRPVGPRALRALGLSVGLGCLLMAWPRSVTAHPAPFSFVDLRVHPDRVDVTVVVHAFDVAYELDVEDPGRVLNAAILGPRSEEVATLLRDRLQLRVDDRVRSVDEWSDGEPLPERQSVRFTAVARDIEDAGVVSLEARLFPYDPNHQTFLNFYEGDRLTTQAILDGRLTEYEFFVGTTQGRWAVVQRFVPVGVHHILIGPDHLLFLIGLLLVGGSVRKLCLLVTGFTLAHSITLSLAVLGLVSPPERIVEAIIALSIVYVGVDNLLSRGGRDVRVWIAIVFGLIHGFGFANVLREMGLPREALGWSLFSFNLGVELGQLAVVAVVATALLALRARNQLAADRVAFAGSIAVIVAGTFWFVERVFLSGGIA